MGDILKDAKISVIKAAKEAGKILMENYGKIKFIKTKKQKSFVTNVDIESENAIFSIIRKKFPEHDILSEEFGSLNKKSDYRWFIDPLDGTHNYINNIPLFGVSIAMAYKDKMQIGVINLPYFKELYVAEKGKGAFLNGKKIRVSAKKELKNSFFFIEFVLRRNPEKKIELFNKIKDIAYDIRVLGSAVVAQAYVAKGSADIYLIQQTNPWDIAAGFLLIEEANGKVTDFKGNEWNPYMGKYIASNKFLHDKILKVLK